MAPTDLVSALYKRYKTGTNHVVQWIANASAQRADVSTIVRDLAKLSMNSKPKGKKSRSTPTSKIPETSPSPVTIISTKDLIALSKALADHAHSRSYAPQGIADTILTLEDVIAGRRECSTGYSHKPYDTDSASDQGHQHFISVLTEVLDNLTSLQKNSKQTQRSVPPDNGNRNHKVNNIYKSLYIEDSSTESDGEAVVSHATKRSSHKQPVPVRLEVDDTEEQAFTLWCFLKECYAIRICVRGIWEECASGGVTAMVASQITKYAILLPCYSIEDFSAQYPSLPTFKAIAKFLDLEASMSGNQIESFSCSENGISHSSGENEMSTADLLCVEAFAGVEIFIRMLEEAAKGNKLSARDGLRHLCTLHPLFEEFLSAGQLLTPLKNDPVGMEYFGQCDIATMLFTTSFRANGNIQTMLCVMVFQMLMQIEDYFSRSMLQCSYFGNDALAVDSTLSLRQTEDSGKSPI